MRRTIRVCTVILVITMLGVLSGSPAFAGAKPHPFRQPWPITVAVQTVPPLPNVNLTFDGTELTTDATGRATYTEEHDYSRHSLSLVTTSLELPERRYKFARWAGQRDPGQAFLPTLTGLPLRANYTVTAAFSVEYPVAANFVDQDGHPLDLSQVSAVKIKSSTGEVLDLPKDGTMWLAGEEPTYRNSRVIQSDLTYSLQSVIMNGTNIVDAGRQRFVPAKAATVTFVGQLHSLTVDARDAVYGAAVGSTAVVTYPDGMVRTVPFDAEHTATLSNLPRGAYKVSVAGASGIAAAEQVGLSRDKVLTVGVLTAGDLVTIATVVLVLAAVLLLIGRRRRQVGMVLARGARWLRAKRPWGRVSRLLEVLGSSRRGAAAVVAIVVATTPQLMSVPQPPTPSPTAAETTRSAMPLFAFYYIWFDPGSWDRAKIDYPQLGHYSSDDPRVMRQHIEWAKSAGIDGFIVSWKDTTTNDRRLQLLMDVARQLDFKLVLIYQGLDFSRNPLPVNQVAADFLTFNTQYANDPVFYRLGGKPLTIWSGTWAYTHDQVAQVTGAVRGSMLVLNTEKNTDGYQRISDVTDGDAYYWSSVDPQSNSGYAAKLDEMSQVVHHDGRYWIAPLAPGFDARLVGGTSTVDRQDGQTLRAEYAAALRSSPNMLGLISWNEFSENSYVEPSEKFGTRYLDVLRELRTTAVPQPPSAADSSGDVPEANASGRWSRWQGFVLLGFPVLLVVVVTLLGYRQRRRRANPQDSE